MKKRIAALLLALVTALPLFGCGIRAQQLTKGITPTPMDTSTDLTSGGAEVAQFALSLLKNTDAGRTGRLVSPISILYALGMTANGASGDTLSQLEDAVGMSLSDLNDYLYTFRMSLPENDKTTRLSLANSLWLRDVFRAEDDFLRTCVDYYGAEVYRSAFDRTLPDDVNGWVEQKTNDMIDRILPERAPDELTMLYLINAAAFEGKWKTAYEKSDVQEGVFTAADGTREDADFMWSKESIYLSGHGATGFLKHYAGERYAFAALLPDEGTTLSELLSALDGDALYDLISKHRYDSVEAALPEFDGETSLELTETLKAMGITDLFDRTTADLRNIASASDDTLYVSSVLHKTHIEVDEEGTRAAAATSIATDAASAAPTETKSVVLNRPFLYMIVDTHACLPIFIGTVTTLDD